MTNTEIPDACLLSNGRYFVQLTAAGTGQSRRHGQVVNRWTGDPVEDRHGQFVYLQDLDSGDMWSTALQPVQNGKARSGFRRSPGSCQLTQECGEIVSRLDVVVPSDEEMEIRRLILSNRSSRPRRIQVTSYFEPVLFWQGSDLGHPAFHKLFLQTSFDATSSILTIRRRARGHDESWPVLFHALSAPGAISYETDRLKFLGRGRSAGNAEGLRQPLSGTVGNVLDPCCSLRTVVEVPAGESREVTFLTGIADSDELARTWCGKYANSDQTEQAFCEADRAERELWQRLKLTEGQAEALQSLAAAIHSADSRLVPKASDLWNAPNAADLFGKFSIPRDRPQIVLVGEWGTTLSREVLQARDYWNAKGCFTNLIVLSGSQIAAPTGLDDRVFTVSPEELSPAEKSVLLQFASLVVENSFPRVTCQASPQSPARIRSLSATPARQNDEQEPLQFRNGYGGFSQDGTEYVIELPQTEGELRRPPLPWINVIANEHAGCLVSETGAGCTWARNSQANRLTPWSNDPVRDPCGEAVYLRDEATGEVWSPLPAPLPAACDYSVRHGLGYSKFLSQWNGIGQEVTTFVPQQDPLKIVHVLLTNHSGHARELSLTSLAQLVMGSLVERPSPLVTRADAKGDLYAVNLAAGNFRGGVAFAALRIHGADVTQHSWTGDRLGFLGRFGSPENPHAMQSGAPLDRRTGAGLDACFAQRSRFQLRAGESVTATILLGEALSEEAAETFIARYSQLDNSQAALHEVREFWRELLGRVRVETPDSSLDFMVNGWLPYQTIACRMWARSAFYQSSGAYGFRDQLQDAGNLLSLNPEFTGRQILLHARNQFSEGDVLHWWHPAPVERGVRTRFADDLLWLPLMTAEYLLATGDNDLLSESVPFLKARLLQPGEDEVYLAPEIAAEPGSLYEHCCRAIDRSLTAGRHGLPLMGTGDWNDGMNRVGREGRGESVWMGFFLDRILTLFTPLCQARADKDRVQKYQGYQTKLRAALNDGGWDGEWYRRAYFDNGAPLGSKQSEECRIDVLPQSWSVFSGAADPPERARGAMAAAVKNLVSEEEGIIRLLTPPFVNTPHDPGYIKGYVAGVRENGGQYTHAACWIVKAVAELGDNERAHRLLRMLLPVSHSLTQEAADLYKVEPYSVAADVYGAEPHIGRGGWTWYTGSSGWLYRISVESVLGVRVEAGNTLVLRPCIPNDWSSYRVTLRRPEKFGECEIEVRNPTGNAKGVDSVQLNGRDVQLSGSTVRIPLSGTGPHKVILTLGAGGGT